MLKKRILASSLASVMALSSVSVVAFADETATADFGAAVNKAELKEKVASFDAFLKDDIYEYGTVQAEQFQDAIDYAENVIEDSEATDEDATAAYQMLMAVYNNLTMYTNDQLQALIDDNQDKYDSKNILNEELGDNKWDEGKYATFEAKFEAAESVVGSDDGRLVNDAYIDLAKAVKDLKLLDSVTKSQFRSVLKEYEAIITSFSSYETWRRGECTVNPSTVNVKNYGAKIKLTDAGIVTFDEIKAIVYGSSEIDGFVDVDHAHSAGTCQWIAHKEATVEQYIKKNYEDFDNIKSSNVTTNEDIVGAYKAAKDAVAVFNGWKEDDTTRAVKKSVEDIINEYRADMANMFVADVCYSLAASNGGKDVKYENGKLTAKQGFELALDANGFVNLVDGAYSTTGADSTKRIAKNTDLMKYIPVTAADVLAYVDSATVTPLVNNYIEKVEDFNDKLAAYKAAVDAKGSSPTTDASVDNTEGKQLQIAQVLKPDGTTEAVAAVNYDRYKYTGSNADSVEAIAVQTYNGKIDDIETAYSALTTAATKAQAAYAALEDYTIEKGIADDYITSHAAYKGFVAALKKDLPTEPTENETNGTTTTVKDTTEYELNALVGALGETLVAEDVTYPTYKTADGSSDTTGKIAPWNTAVSDKNTAYTNLKTAATTGSIADFTEKLAAVKAIQGIYDFDDYDADVEDACERLAKGLTIAHAYLSVTGTNFNAAYASGLDDLDENNVVADKPTGSRTEYTLIYRYLKYALEDLYPSSSNAKYTKNDVKKLIDKCYDLAELTGDAEVFSAKHQALVEGRKAALEWLTEANADKKYKDGNTVSYEASYTLTGAFAKGDDVAVNATTVYEKLNDLYTALEEQLSYYPVSYGDIADLIATVGAGLDDGVYGASATEIKTLVEKVALGLSTLDASGDDNEPFTTDRDFVAYNRLYTKEETNEKGTKANDDEKALYKNYNTLKDAVEKALEGGDEPEFVKGDLNNDGKADPNDAVMVISLFLEGAEYNKVADYNEDGKVDPNDAVAIVEAFLNA